MPPRYKTSLKVVLERPFVFKMNTEPWPTTVSTGRVDLWLDCKTKHISSDSATYYMPYFYAGFCLRKAYLPIEALQPPIQREKTKFLGFTSSYCRGRVKTAAMRSIFFDLVSQQYKQASAMGK